MKKLIITLIVCIALVSSITALAADEITVTVNGEVLETPIAPQLVNDRTMLPMRAIFEKLRPPQKETPESEARNARWRTGKFGGRKAREQKKESAKKEPSKPQAAQKQNAVPTPKTHTGTRLGSRARRRLREEQAKRQQSQNG